MLMTLPLLFATFFCNVLTLDIPLSSGSLTLVDQIDFTSVEYKGASVFRAAGEPSLPELPLSAALPVGYTSTGIEELHAYYTPITGRVDIAPVAIQSILSSSVFPPAPEPNADIYSSVEFFPESPVRFIGAGIVMGHSIVDFMVSPLRWNPSTGALEQLTYLQVSFSLESSSERSVHISSVTGGERIREIVSRSVINPSNVELCSSSIVEASDLEYGEYIIVTHPDYIEQAEEIAVWKTRKGVPASVYTTEWIASNYTGCVDLSQSIRAFLTDCRDQGAYFVLIFGDDDAVPARKAIVSYPPDTLYPPVDLYWADINDQIPGEDLWDSNNNGVWGEYGLDDVDFHPDLFTGRASVNSIAEANTFVDKVFAYERIASSDYFETAPIETRMGYTTTLLWSDPVPCYGSAGAEMISLLVPTGSTWEEEKCYESTGNNSFQITLDMINSGPSHLYQSCHGSASSFSVPGGFFTIPDIMSLKNIENGGLPIIMNSTACDIGHFDGNECIAEAWLASPNGGGFGGFNARYGWGNVYDPGNGACEIICRGIYEALWIDGQNSLGAMHFMGRDKVIPPAHEVWDWCIKEYNLFGDPEMQIWTESPGLITAQYPDAVTGTTVVEIVAQSEGAPISGALICLLKGDDWQNAEVYLTALTDESGYAAMNVAPESTGQILLCITADNHFPLLDSIEVVDLGLGSEFIQGVTALGSLSPNPAQSTASVELYMAETANLEAIVYDISGRTVLTLAGGEFCQGLHNLVWNLEDSTGLPVSNGLYYMRVSTGRTVMTERLTVIR